jgi:AcrR family transcriptional regulator
MRAQEAHAGGEIETGSHPSGSGNSVSAAGAASGVAAEGEAPATPRLKKARPVDSQAPVPVSRAGQQRPRQEHGDSHSRQRIIEAAIACILEQGFYRASSNAIAERAGLSWGAIQYHFGTREALMLAVLQEGAHRFAGDVLTAEITGETIVERVEEFFDILAKYYASPDYLAFTQVLLNLRHDPRTSQQTLATVAEINETANPALRRLQTKVFEGTGVHRREVHNLLFHALRGMAISEVMLSASHGISHSAASTNCSRRRSAC